MPVAVGVRMNDDMLNKVDVLSEEDCEDRSTVIRKLILKGYKEVIKEKAAEQYLRGGITLSEAAHRAGLTIWDMERYLIERGFRSSYSVEEMLNEAEALGHKKSFKNRLMSARWRT